MSAARIPYTTLDGRSVVLRAYVERDGAISFWEPCDAVTGRHVDLSSDDKWLAISAMHMALRAAS